MLWVYVVGAVVVAMLIFKLLVKPLLKIGALIALAVVVWLLLTNLH